MSADIVLLVAYAVGYCTTARIAWASFVREFGQPTNFGDFGGAVYLSFGAALVWPVIAPVYAAYLLYRRATP